MAVNSEISNRTELKREWWVMRSSLLTLDVSVRMAPRNVRALPVGEERVRIRPAEALQGFARRELLLLVQRLFLMPEAARNIVVISGVQGAQSSALTACIADLLSDLTSARICLIDANRSHPTAHESFGLDGRHGLEQCVASSLEPERFLQQVSDNLWVLPWGPAGAGTPPERTIEGLQGIVGELATEFDFLLIACANADSFDDALKLGLVSQGVVLVLRNHLTNYVAAQHTRDQLLEAGVEILGAVLQDSIATNTNHNSQR